MEKLGQEILELFKKHDVVGYVAIAKPVNNNEEVQVFNIGHVATTWSVIDEMDNEGMVIKEKSTPAEALATASALTVIIETLEQSVIGMESVIEGIVDSFDLKDEIGEEEDMDRVFVKDERGLKH